MRVGIGYDSHRFAEGESLILGGVRIEHERGLAGHSDADVVAHAVIDALLGASGLGDLGTHFPPGDETWRDADSLDRYDFNRDGTINVLDEMIARASQRASLPALTAAAPPTIASSPADSADRRASERRRRLGA